MTFMIGGPGKVMTVRTRTIQVPPCRNDSPVLQWAVAGKAGAWLTGEGAK